MARHTFQLHTLPQDGGVSFVRFRQFFSAMQTTDATTDHYSMVVYRFADDTQTEYRLQATPCQTHTGSRVSPLRVARCLERASSYIYMYPAAEPPPAKQPTCRDNTFKTVLETELVERWTFTSDGRTYTLTKSAKAATKGEASRRAPRFDISIDSPDDSCVYDLFGRFSGGVETPLCPEWCGTPTAAS